MKNNFLKNYLFPILLLSGVIIGSIIGIIFKDKASVLKPLGDIFINLLFTAVVPLIFVSISNSIVQMENMKRLGRIIVTMFIIFFITGFIAGSIMIIISVIFNPAQGVNIPMEIKDMTPPQISEQIVKMITVSNFVDLLSINNILPMIIFSIFFGFAVKLVGEKAKPLAKILDITNEVFMKIISIIMYYAPIGLGAYFANLVGTFGPQLLGSYARACAIYYPVAFLYLIIFFPIYVYIAAGRYGLKSLKYLIAPIITSLSTQSSLATLPINLEAAEKIGVKEDIRNIVLPIGSTTHMDGTCLSGILKISFLFGIFGMPFNSIETWIGAIIFAVFSGVAMGAISGGGLMGEMLIVSLYGFPPEAFAIIAAIGILVDPPATMVNAVGDTVASMLVSRVIEGKDWFKNKVTS